MNFSPFGSHFPASLPIHQFAAKFGHENGAGPLCTGQEGGSSRYATTSNGMPSFTQHHPPHQQQHLINAKYQGPPYVNPNANYSHPGSLRPETTKRQGYDHQELAQELCAVMLQQSQQPQGHPDKQQQQTVDKCKQERQQAEEHRQQQQQQQVPQQSQNAQPPPPNNQAEQANASSPSGMPATWQSLAAPGSTVADYLSHLPASTLPLSLHHFLKYSTETIKKEGTHMPPPESNLSLLNMNGGLSNSNVGAPQPTKKKKKKKSDKEKKPRPKPGEIRLTTALDGSTLYCCPECHMAYPEKELLEQHLVGHTLERRFVCDICGAGLKRKDHLTRHKQSHNPERPYVCTVCLKAFKRKEQLTLHFVIHSGEKRHICTECGKGFYRKDHLRKHTRSHIARRVKAELSQQSTSTLQIQVATPVPTSSNVLSQGIMS